MVPVMVPVMASGADCAALDAADTLAPLRDLFALPEGLVYLDGHSLGAMPRAAAARLAVLMQRDWGETLIGGWNNAGWLDLPARVGDKVAPIVGAPPGTVIASDSTTNLYKLLGAALALRPGRRVILSEAGNFPTDLYVADSLAVLLGRGHTLQTVPGDRIAETIGPDVAVILLSHVDYRTGAIHDMKALTRAAHRAGALILWDLAHSAGAIPTALAESDADFAVGCGYKFLNGGPGAPAFLYAAARLHGQLEFPIRGWFGHAAPFAFEPSFRPAPGVTPALVGTPAVLGLTALEAGIDVFAHTSVAALRTKAVALGEMFIALVERECAGFGLELVSPRDPGRRGNQVSLRHRDGFAIVQALIAERVVGDFRTPDIMRFGFAPLYLRFFDVWLAAHALRRVLAEQLWRHPAHQVRRGVT